MLAVCVIFYLLLTLPVVIYASMRIRSSRDYVLAGRHLPFFVSFATVFATWFGAETVMGCSSRVVEKGLLGIIEDPFGTGLCLILVGLFVVRKLYSQNHLTLGDYFEARFGKRTSNWLSAIIASTYLGWIGAQFVALGIILDLVFGVPFAFGIIISCLIVILYTYIGGMWSVALTDTIQTVVIMISLLIALFQIEFRTGAWQATLENTPPEFFRILPKADSASILTYINSWIILGLGSIPQQDVYQRAMSAKSERISQLASILGGAFYFTFALIPVFMALAARALHPELLSTNPQYFLPIFIIQETDILTQILFFGGLIAAILSTASGSLLAASSLLAENVVTIAYTPRSDKDRLRLMRKALVVVAFAALAMCFYQDYIHELVSSAYSISIVGAFIPFVFALYCPRAQSRDCLVSSFSGVITWLSILFFAPESFILPAPLGGLIVSFFAMLISLCFKPKPKTCEITA